MEIFIDETVAKRRRELKMTQEELAFRLGVSAQAVSNWERKESYPDVTILPVLATVLGTSTDELLGMGRETETQIIEKWLEDMRDPKKRKMTVLRYYKEYPKCYGLMSKLCWWIYRWGGEDPSLRKAAVDMAKRILAECTDTDRRLTAAKVLAFLLDDEEADYYIDLFGMSIQIKPSVIAKRAQERGELEKAQAYFDLEHFWIFINLCMRSAYCGENWEKSLRYYELRANMIKTVGNGKVPEGLWWLYSTSRFFQSEALFALGRKEEGYETLEESVKAYETWGSFPQNKPLSVGAFSPAGDVTVSRIGEMRFAINVQNELFGSYECTLSVIWDETQIQKMFGPILDENKFKELLQRFKTAEGEE